MQPYNVQALHGLSDEETSDGDSEYSGGEQPEINDEEYTSIDKIREDLLKFKTKLYDTRVGNATDNPEDLKALSLFQELFLDCNAYLMKVLNGREDISFPELPEEEKTEFKEIVSNIKNILKNTNTNVLVLDILSKINSMPISFLASDLVSQR